MEHRTSAAGGRMFELVEAVWPTPPPAIPSAPAPALVVAAAINPALERRDILASAVISGEASGCLGNIRPLWADRPRCCTSMRSLGTGRNSSQGSRRIPPRLPIMTRGGTRRCTWRVGDSLPWRSFWRCLNVLMEALVRQLLVLVILRVVAAVTTMALVEAPRLELLMA